MATVQHDITVGDTLTPLAVQLKQKNASGTLEAVNLSGLTIKFSMCDDAGTVIVDEATTGVTVTDASSGKVQYDFQAADVDAAGTFYGWFHVYNGAERDTFPAGGRNLIINISEVG